ncbi:MAG TPA: VWA containing CoxE family protein, partial [Candidatus Angelobacter sp.]|nr:VWA containing CoxE family protein [Candidatus Angelobacter sp.]
MPAAKSIDQAIVEFCHFARANGLLVSVQESLDSLRAAEAIGIAEPERFKFALRAVMCSSKQDWDLFADIFDD